MLMSAGSLYVYTIYVFCTLMKLVLVYLYTRSLCI